MTDILIYGIPVVIAIAIFYVHHIETDEDKLLTEKRRKLEQRLAKFHKELDLLVALSEQLMPIKEDMDRLGADVAGRHAVVKISDWPEQYAFGIEKCCGFILDWK